MKLKDATHAYTFDDLVLSPVQSDIESRGDPDISVPNAPIYSIPIVSSPMSTITEVAMAETMRKQGGGSAIHRYMPIEEQAKMAGFFYGSDGPMPFAAIGSNGDAMERASALYEAGCRKFLVDVANGHNIHCVRTVQALRERWSHIDIMAGNVVTSYGTEVLIGAGANFIRIGVGSGAACTTRLVTGHGLPQLSAVEECAQVKPNHPDVVLISDGGIRGSGDIVKSLAAGADMIMIGSLLAATSETPGDIIEEEGKLYKCYSGMASDDARSKWFDKSKEGIPPEGISIKVPYSGKSAAKIIKNLSDSVKVGLSYSGAKNILELREKASWRLVTGAGFAEGLPHGKNR